MTRIGRRLGALAFIGATAVAWALPSAAAPEGQVVSLQAVSIAPRWFDPAEAEGIITPYLFYYALHDAVVKPMPGKPLAPSLAESWTTSPDGLTYEFVLRQGVKFHNGDTLSAEDVKFSFDRYKGAAAATYRARVAAVEVVDPGRIRFRLRQPWPDFMTFYGTPATGAGWVVPKKYVERVGDDGFKKAPVGAGPYKFVAYKPGVELVLEAHEQFWRKTPSVKHLVIKSVPDEATRLAMLKRGEADISTLFRGPLAEELRRTPGLTLKPTYLPVTQLAPLRRAVGSQIALGGPPRAPRRQPGHRPRGHQSGRDPRALEGHGQHHSAELRLLLARPALWHLSTNMAGTAPYEDIRLKEQVTPRLARWLAPSCF